MAKTQGRKVILHPGAPATPAEEDPTANMTEEEKAAAEAAAKALVEGDGTGDIQGVLGDGGAALQAAVGSTEGADPTQTTPDGPPAPEEPVQGLPYTQPVYDGMPKDGIVLSPTDPLYVRGFESGPVIVLTEDVYRAHKPKTSLNYIFTLVYSKGTRVDKTFVRLLPDKTA